MSLSKKQEKEVLKVYDTWLESYLNGDIETYDSYLDDSFHFVGSTDNEEFLNRKDTTKFFKETADQFSGKTDIRNDKRVIEKFGELIILTHVFDAWFLNEGAWSYYGRFRFTSTLQEKKEGWRFIYQHFSTPDIMADEGETLGIDKITAENLELRNAIKRRTVELELKNRALEVETSLERIRAKVTAMKQSSDLLDIVVAIRNEFTNLGHRADYFWHMMWLPDKFEKAMTSGDGSRIGMVMELPRDFHSHYEGMDEWEGNDEPVMVLALEVEEAVDYLHKMITLGNFRQVDPQAPTLDDIRHIGGITFIMARTSHGEIGYSLPGVVKHPPEEDLKILERLAGVFDLAHKRFEDLQRSERQNRETQIELGIEKVRARAMAMQNSSELSDLVDTVFTELSKLDFGLQACIINIIDADHLRNTVWMKSPDVGNTPDSYLLKFEDYPFHHAMMDGYLKRESKFIYVIEGDEKQKYDKYLFADTEFRKISKEAQDSFKTLDKYVCSFTFSNFGGLQTIGQEPLSDENLDILARFGKVFDLTYTRFNDLKLAEAQARESRIELALERVRARTMAMQQSEELGDVATVLFKELNELVENLWTCGFVLCEKDRKEDEWWLSTEEGFIPPLFLPNVGDDTHHNIYEAWKNGATYHTEQLEGDALNKHYDWLMTIPAAKEAFDTMQASGIDRPSWQKLHCAYFSYGYLVMITKVPCPEEEIFKRFARVFDQTYTRFLDLQKAEEQARESEVELALERVRSRSMAMHQSDELKDIIQLIFDQMNQLNIHAEHAGIVVDYEPKKDFHFWVADTQNIPAKITVPYLDLVWDKQFTEAKKKGEDFFTTQLNFEEKNSFYKQLLPHIDGLTKKAEDFYLACPGLAASTVIQNDIGIYIENFSGIPFSEEENSILIRIGKVFQQTYTRFLDLQKAEAQAREAQIEAALERIRSRTMAMQHSDELLEVASVMFQQVKDLGVSQWNCGFNIWEDGDQEFTYYPGSPDGKIIPFTCKIPLNEHPVFRRFDKSRKKGEELLVYEKKGKEQKDHYDYMLSLPEVGDFLRSMMEADFELPAFQIDHVANFLYGNLIFITYEPFPEMHDVFKRFAKVFEQTYTRFLDLKKAEAQAREAQIEMALEKVRSRTMAMHNSSELPEAANNLFLQVQELGIPAWSAGYCIWEDDQKSASCSMSSEGEIQKEFSLPTIGEGYNFYKPFKNKEPFHVAEIGGKALVKHYDFMKTLPIIGDVLEDFNEKGIALPSFQIFHIVYFTHGYLMFITYEAVPQEWEVFKRFGKVFEQTFTRFLDLQKAEAQAREAQIEAALEKIRSRTMAMQKGEEVKDVVVLLYKELITLGVTNFASCGYVEINEKTQLQSTWVTSPGGDSLGLFYLPLTGDVHFNARYEAWKKQQTVFHQTVAGKERKKHLEYAITTFNSKEAEEMVLNQFPDPTVFYCFNFSHGYLHLVAGSILTEEEETLLARFTRVFEQTYARFLDLQKAEVQAREAQIETALERVRSRTMAMHNSSELADTATVLFQQLKELAIDHERTNIGIVDEANGKIDFWLTTQKGNLVDKTFPASISESDTLKTFYKGYKEKRKSIIVEQKGEELKRWISFITNKLGIPYTRPTRNEIRVQNVVYISQGMLIATSTNPLNDESVSILERFGAVFEQTYTRFLDLQKAEAQAKEAQIEAALEKVRSRSLAMQKPEELQEVVAVVAEKLQELGVIFDAGGVILCTYFPDNKDVMHWIAVSDFSTSGSYLVPYFDNPIFNDAWDSKNKGDAYFSKEFTVEAKNDFFKHAFENSGYRDFPDDYKEHVLQADNHRLTAAWSKNSAILIPSLTGAIPSENDAEIMKRFAKVFEQAYIRFLDLQKAEAQAREAQIEAALERTRNQSMQMQHSDEIKDLSKIFHEQLHVLNIPSEFSYVWLPEEDKEEHMFWATWSETTKGSTATLSKSVVYPLDKSEPYTAACYKAWTSKEPVHQSKILAKETAKFFDTWKELLKGAKKLKARYFPEGIYYAEAYMKYGCFGINIRRALQHDEADILHRFAVEFERGYMRFLDLKKAEAQAREAQIEGALERVRSKTMAMHNSQDVGATIGAMFDELVKLGIEKSVRCGIGILDHTKPMELWTASSNSDEEVILSIGFLDMSIHPLLTGVKKAWEKNEVNFKYELKGKNLLKYFTAINESPDYLFQVDLESLPKKIIHNSFLFSEGTLFAFSPHPLTKEEEQIFKRFTGVFAQTYTRYLDLLKAEAQVREAQIEAALERVRSQTMAMHDSQDVGKTVVTFFDEVMKLGLNNGIRCGIGILEDREKMETWSATSSPNGDVELQVGLLDMKRHPLIKGLEAAWKNKEDGYIGKLIGDDVVRYYEQLIEEPDYPFNVDLENLSDIEYHRSFFFSSGIIFTFTKTPISEEAALVLNRFAAVFGQTYRRYLDLQNAEAQARESQIEASLEKVRARTMAMQSSSELTDAANVLFNQVRDLGVNAWSAGYNVLSDDKTQSTCWMSSEDQLQDPFPLYFTEEASFIEMGKFLKSEADFFVQELGGDDLIQHYDYMKSVPKLYETFQELEKAGLDLPTYQINHLCKFNKGFLLFITYEPSPEAHDIFKRFTKVFEQTYTRFLDLQKAEDQSKEAQIELALERVRASTMAMHQSEQLAETAEVLFEQFDLLGVTPDRISVAIFNEKNRLFELWATDQRGSNVNHVHDFSIDEPTCVAKIYKAWNEKKETFVVDLKGKELKDWIRYVKDEAKMQLDESQFQGRRVQHAAFFSQGFLLLSSHLPISKEILQLLLRFAKVFQQTYTRFLDLKRAEAQAREAIKHASVDRVRAEIASMRNTSDLKRITPLIWNELNTLDVPFIRCGVFIMDEEKQEVQTHLSTPDGKAIASFNLPFENTEPLTELLPHWRKKEMYKDYWDASAFVASMNVLMDRGAISSNESYMTDHQPDNLHLHFLPFLQGMLYVGSEVPLTEDELYLVQNLAKAFSTAYSRYEDFNRLELANKKIEKTLTDLKQTQTQLVQSEKMASLGELTAGIAHEIQNPLNFVNNFSEVSAELVDEMNEEIEEGNLDFAKEIAVDLKQNLEKINHHGKRAGEIVKGMLQHSRTSSGQKELTDINALADEYLRLAYHGLRAKDKSFNAKMESKFDPDLPKMEVIPQDIGRVILNMITNAFYVVDEKKKSGIENYEPTVWVTTKKMKDGIEVSVKDNGNGIPKKVLDKIFQPFFTTKPTGKGTGLGLSLSYDIVKAHGGKLTVKTNEGEGTEFIIFLPLN